VGHIGGEKIEAF